MRTIGRGLAMTPGQMGDGYLNVELIGVLRVPGGYFQSILDNPRLSYAMPYGRPNPHGTFETSVPLVINIITMILPSESMMNLISDLPLEGASNITSWKSNGACQSKLYPCAHAIIGF